MGNMSDAPGYLCQRRASNYCGTRRGATVLPFSRSGPHKLVGYACDICMHLYISYIDVCKLFKKVYTFTSWIPYIINHLSYCLKKWHLPTNRAPQGRESPSHLSPSLDWWLYNGTALGEETTHFGSFSLNIDSSTVCKKVCSIKCLQW